MTTQHTPTPWSFAAVQCAGIGIASMTDGNLNAPRRTSAIAGRSPMDGGEGWHFVAALNDHVESAADAEFIVRACNAHDELVAALQSLIAQAEADPFMTVGHFVEHVSTARAALAKVQK